MKTWLQIPLGVIIGLAISAAVVLVIAPPKGEPILLPPAPTPGMIYVDVAGAVNAPGVYKLDRDARTVDAIDRAGGLSADADPLSINLASKIEDGDKIIVLSRTQKATQTAFSLTASVSDSKRGAATLTPTPSFPININTASLQELQELPSIGPTKAAQIIAYRQEHGPFQKLEDLTNVSGIGPSTLEKIRAFVTLGK